MAKNAQWIYARKPEGAVTAAHFDPAESAMPEPKDGEVLVRTTLLSLDPASRAWMAGRTYRSMLQPGEVMAGWGLGEVVESTVDAFRPGDLVSGEYGWQRFATMPARALTKHDKRHRPEHILGVLGITGLTAYFGMLDVGRPRPGEPVGRGDLVRRPIDDLRLQAVPLAVAEDGPHRVGLLLPGPPEELPPVGRRVRIVVGRGLPGVSPVRFPPDPDRGAPFRVKRLLQVLARVVGLGAGDRPGRRPRARGRDLQAGQQGQDPTEVLGPGEPGLVNRDGDLHRVGSSLPLGHWSIVIGHS
jgi:hypothetical protein